MTLQIAHYTRSLFATAILLSISLSGLDGKIAPVDAACRTTGQRVGGMSLLKCSGSTRCRPTGQIRRVNGVSYRVMTCPRR
ncbi:hypothetical protein V0288_24430 [Pannus brasiliensis CCIBt3594]|uniref:Uncharacterized protein n=1 Tax=Pannus brasiliensis CCIBt3594 TaxID=1427578 RepID=A0AAW9QR81_9CHRO